MIIVSLGSISSIPNVYAETPPLQEVKNEDSPTKTTSNQTEAEAENEHESTTEQNSSDSFTKELEEGSSQILEDREDLRTEIDKAVKELLKIQTELAQFNKQIHQFEQAMADNNKIIEETKAKISKTNQEITRLEKEIKILNESIEKRLDILKKRVSSLQQTGGNVGYLNVLVGSTSFSNFVDRAYAVMTILKSDLRLMKQAESDVQRLEDKQDSVEKKLEELTDMKVEYEGMLSHILEQKKQQDVLKQAVEQKEQESLDFMAELYKKDQDLALEAEAIKDKYLKEQGDKLEVYSESTLESIEYIKQFEPSSPDTSESLTEAIINSYHYIGNSVYIFGAGRNQHDIDNGRFDCSGFVHHVFSEAGITVGATTDTLKNDGVQIPSNAMQFGDLVFFDTYKIDGHVGIYLGEGKFLGSQSSTGVAIADMTTGYWKDTFNGRVVRIQ